MNVHLGEKNGRKYVEGIPDKQFIHEERDAVELMGICGEHSTERLLLYAGNLSENFFDLKSGLAGTILQKFMNYHLKIAFVISSDLVQGKFKEYVFEANRGEHFHTFQNRSDAEAWLTTDGPSAERVVEVTASTG